LAFTDLDLEFIGNAPDFTGWDPKGFGNSQGTGTWDAILLGRFMQPAFQLFLLH
jgi:hypothetical protein